MSTWGKKITQAVQSITSATSSIVSYLILIITMTVTIEVVGRYVFNHPTSWVWPINRLLFGVFILVALCFTQSTNGHIRIEIVYERLSPRIKTIARWFALAVTLIFVAVLFWQTSIMAISAIAMKERASGAFRIPLYPFKALIPIAAFMLGVEVITSFKSPKKD